MSYTELLLVFNGVRLVGRTAGAAGGAGGRRAAAWRSRRIRSWVSRTRSRARVADRARREVWCGSAAERLVGWI